ncbi:universal stress protein [Thiocapsa sp. UBA6158]|jgi:nucleotide-binding universal stress UspA family protein|uniref:universal stress protein n=1 Tax=Thiocapsa sp. UBA6158 TaxID=1947692 RepID=UPI0025CF2347|nr:universal stress protein [Thiocapsa sp. UBA6158]
MERFKKILFVVDPEKSCQPALERAVALAAHNQADLAVVAVIPRLHAGIHLSGDGTTSDDLQGAAQAQQRVRLSSLIEPYGRRHRIRTDVLIGTPYLEIVREVLSEGHDLVIRPPDGAASSGRLIGTDEMNLLRKCPVRCGSSSAGDQAPSGESWRPSMSATATDPARRRVMP